MALFRSSPPIPSELLDAFRDSGSHGPKLGRKRLAQSLEALSAELRGEAVEYVTPAGWGVVAVTSTRVIQIAGGAVRAVLERSAIAVRIEPASIGFEFAISGPPGLRFKPIHFYDLAEARQLAAAIELPAGAERAPATRLPDHGAFRLPARLLSSAHRRALQRLGREAYGPPSPGAQPRIVQPSGAEILLDAAAAMGIDFPVPGSPHWREYESRLCSELLEAAGEAGGWSIAGALYVAVDLDTSSENPLYLEILDRGVAFLRAQGVSGMVVPNFLFTRWVDVGDSH